MCVLTGYAAMLKGFDGSQRRPGAGAYVCHITDNLRICAASPVRAECLTAWAQLMAALVAERHPGRHRLPSTGLGAGPARG